VHPRERLTCLAIARVRPFANTAPHFLAMSLVNRLANTAKCEINNSWPIMSVLVDLPDFPCKSISSREVTIGALGKVSVSTAEFGVPDRSFTLARRGVGPKELVAGMYLIVGHQV
jgi:hypothetical protein